MNPVIPTVYKQKNPFSTLLHQKHKKYFLLIDFPSVPSFGARCRIAGLYIRANKVLPFLRVEV